MFYPTAICVPPCLKNETCVGPNKCKVSTESTAQVKEHHVATRVKRDDDDDDDDDDDGNEHGGNSSVNLNNYNNYGSMIEISKNNYQ